MDEKALFAINNLKDIITKKPVLKIYHQQHETELHTDASMEGYGAVLLQESPDDDLMHTVYYMSKKNVRS